MPDPHLLPITDRTWMRLVQANREAVNEGWAQPGIFGTGIGPAYRHGAPRSVLYVGKSAGPLAGAVGSGEVQSASVQASTDWMIGRRNLSAFWQLIDIFDRSRRSIAWTNVCKMDRRAGDRPPSGEQWKQIQDVCLTALSEEIDSLAPHTLLFATSDAYRADVDHLLRLKGYMQQPAPFDDGWTGLYVTSEGSRAITTKHPQGWPSANRKMVIDLLRRA